MPLLIDGYNLLHVTGIVGEGQDLTSLHRSREGLLRFLAASIEPAERRQTTIVFDASGAPPGLPRSASHEGITVLFARDYADADAMLEDLIRTHHAPRKLVVVSGDHRVQRAARRRRAKAIDSHRWYAELRARPASHGTAPTDAATKPSGKLSAEEVAYWVGKFSQPPSGEADRPNSSAQPPRKRRSRKKTAGDDTPSNPFPPGYGEDLLSE